MPSVSLGLWRTHRMLSLQEIDNQFATSLALAPPNPRPSEQNLRGYIVVAHHNAVPPGGLPSQADLQRWRNSCDGLAASLEESCLVN